MVKVIAKMLNVLSKFLDSAEDVAVSVNGATKVMRANVENWQKSEEIKLADKIRKQQESAKAITDGSNKDVDAKDS
jgi:hypothetical protein